MKSTVTCFILVTCITFITCELCPSPEKISPCKCSSHPNSISIVCQDHKGSSLNALETIVQRLSAEKNLNLELHNFNLGQVPSKMFSGLDIRTLIFYGCNIISLAEEGGTPFTGLENSLKELRIKDSLQTRTGSDKAAATFGHLLQLYHLDIQMNDINNFNNDWFRGGPASLEDLYLSDNNIFNLGDKAFANLSNVKIIDLSRNSVERIERSMFPNPAQKLYELRLQKNGISSLPDDIFSNMPTLSIIDLQGNEILKLDERTWSPVWNQLNALYLSENPLNCDTDMEWIFKRQKPENIYGQCESPVEKKGKYLHELYEKKERMY